MKSISRPALCAICLVTIFILGFITGRIGDGKVNLVPEAQAKGGEGNGSRRCSNRTLQGAYGIKFEGQSLTGGPIASVSRVTFDGQGEFTVSEVARFNGNLVRRTFTGPYTVNADCTGFLDFSSEITDPPHEAHGEFVIVDGGKEFFILDNEEGWVAGGVGKKL